MSKYMHKIPIIRLDNKRYKLMIDSTIYSKEAIIEALYDNSHKFYAYQMKNEGNDNLIDILFEQKKNCALDKEIILDFINNLIEHQLRYNINKQFSHIRDAIVQEAFKPINKMDKL